MVFGSLIGLGVRAAVATGLYAATSSRMILVEHDVLSPQEQAERRIEADQKRKRYETNLQSAMDRMDDEAGSAAFDSYDEEVERAMARRRCCLVVSIVLIVLGIIITVLCLTLTNLNPQDQDVSTPRPTMAAVIADSNLRDQLSPNDFSYEDKNLALEYADGSQTPSSLGMTRSEYDKAENFRLWGVSYGLATVRNYPVCCLYRSSLQDHLDSLTFIMTGYRYHRSLLSSPQQALCDSKLILYCYPN